MSQSLFSSHRHPSSRKFKSVLVIASFAIIAVVACVWFLSQRIRPSNLDDVVRAVSEQRLADAEDLARSWLESHPDDVAGRLVFGDILQRQGSLFEAIDVYQKIPADAGEQSVSARLAMASILMRQGRLADAEAKLRAVQTTSNQMQIADGLWVTLLSLSGQQWKCMPYLERTLDSVGDRMMKLIYLANPDEMAAPPEDVFNNMLRIRDPLGALGCGRIAASLGRNDQAIQLFRECLAKRPEIVEAYAALGAALLDSGHVNEFDQLLSNLPATAEKYPSIWFLRGRRAQDLDQRRDAIRCYWEVLRRHPNQDRATYQLGQLLAAEGHFEDAKLFSERAKRLTQLIELSVKLYDNRGAEPEIADCARLTYELGRWRECRVWCDELRSRAPENSTRLGLDEKLRSKSTDETPWILPSENLAARIDLASYPLPNLAATGSPPRTPIRPENSVASQIAFVDDAAATGMSFVYFNADDPSSKGKRMFEYTGGGVAAIDYDCDGWCDLYFTQGTSWPPDPSNLQYLDVMYRNVAGQRMQAVTSEVGIRDAGFGQGVSSADFDNDGFPDLYVANIDGNRLYKNQGDGTFRDVTQTSHLGKHPHWTTSCVLADLNGDSLPDAYDVTFLQGDEVFSRICQGDDGVPRSCAPALFPAAPDHVYINLGDGVFQEVTQQWGFDAPNGDGLGIVVADFDDTGTISVFVGNDGRANFCFAPDQAASGETHFSEIGVISGLAYNDSGAAQASMGIAAGDANNDGRLDLFVTNFYNESNTLYINLGSRSFTDRARSSGIYEASWLMLGFGTQFIDADRDGLEDLILVNGHVDDFTHKQIPYKMRPQFFHNHQARFAERFGKELGPFFDEQKLGRGLARIDWNRDGLNDVVISHIGDPAALLTNRTQNPGYGLGLKLVGTTRSRDAIGARVTVTAGNTRLTRQLSGGDGYQATNERRLEFGLADDRDDIEIEIHWMGGAVESFRHVPSNQEYVAIEGRGELLRLHAD